MEKVSKSNITKKSFWKVWPPPPLGCLTSLRVPQSQKFLYPNLLSWIPQNFLWKFGPYGDPLKNTPYPLFSMAFVIPIGLGFQNIYTFGGLRLTVLEIYLQKKISAKQRNICKNRNIRKKTEYQEKKLKYQEKNWNSRKKTEPDIFLIFRYFT